MATNGNGKVVFRCPQCGGEYETKVYTEIRMIQQEIADNVDGEWTDFRKMMKDQLLQDGNKRFANGLHYIEFALRDKPEEMHYKGGSKVAYFIGELNKPGGGRLIFAGSFGRRTIEAWRIAMTKLIVSKKLNIDPLLSP